MTEIGRSKGLRQVRLYLLSIGPMWLCEKSISANAPNLNKSLVTRKLLLSGMDSQRN